MSAQSYKRLTVIFIVFNVGVDLIYFLIMMMYYFVNELHINISV